MYEGLRVGVLRKGGDSRSILGTGTPRPIVLDILGGDGSWRICCWLVEVVVVD